MKIEKFCDCTLIKLQIIYVFNKILMRGPFSPPPPPNKLGHPPFMSMSSTLLIKDFVLLSY